MVERIKLNFDKNSTNEIKKYYENFFLCNMMFEWLNYTQNRDHGPYDNIQNNKRREFCFTLENDIFERFKSFGTSEDMKESLIAKIPQKIDIGPLYNYDPEMRQSYHVYL